MKYYSILQQKCRDKNSWVDCKIKLWILFFVLCGSNYKYPKLDGISYTDEYSTKAPGYQSFLTHILTHTGKVPYGTSGTRSA